MPGAAFQAVAISAAHGIAAATSESDIFIWDLATGKLLTKLSGHQETVVSLSFAPEHWSLVSGSLDRTVRIWNLRDGSSRLIRGPETTVSRVASAADERALAIAWRDGLVELRGANDEVLQSGRHDDQITGLAFSPDGNSLVSCSLDGRLLVFGTSGTVAEHTVSGMIKALAWAPDGQSLALALGDGVVTVLDAAFTPLTTLQAHEANISAIAYFDAETIVTSGSDGRVNFVYLPTRRIIRSLHMFETWVTTMAADKQWMISSDYSANLILCDFAASVRQFAQQPELQAAINTPSAAGLARLGSWYGESNQWQWSRELLLQASQGGAAVDPVLLARAHWLTDDAAGCARYLTAALARDDGSSSYLTLWLRSLEAGP